MPGRGPQDAEVFRICVPCSMIEQETHEADNSSRVPTGRPACYESVAAIAAMLVRALSGGSLALPLRHRVWAVRMPALGSAALVATAVLGLGRGPGGTTRPGSQLRCDNHVLDVESRGPAAPRPEVDVRWVGQSMFGVGFAEVALVISDAKLWDPFVVDPV
jgi:hypothetical protein